MKEIFENVFFKEGRIYTKNLTPGISVYGEKLVVEDGIEYREWNPFRSKLGGAIKKGLSEMPLKRGSDVLYLGASTGTTVSHVSDIVEKGSVYGVEISQKMMQKLLELAELRENIIPILADARKPHEYEEIGKVDVIYQDVAQPDQDRILMINANMFLKKGGYAMLCIKSQSIDVTKKPKDVFEEVKRNLSSLFEVVQSINLEPYDKEHEFVLLRKVK